MRRLMGIMAMAAGMIAQPGIAAPIAAADIDTIFSKWSGTATPGCAVGIEQGPERFSKAYGMADLEHDVANSPATIFEAGSVSKQFTAAAVLLLAQDGLLRLDDDIRKHLPEMPDYGARITINELLTHTSGIRDWGVLSDIEGWPRTTRAMTQPDVLALVSRQRALNHAPRAEFSYTNSGYNLLVMIVERVSKERFQQFSHRRIFAPLGMTSTSWRDDFRHVVKGRAIAYAKSGETYRQQMPFEDAIGNGGLLTTTGDLLLWNRALSDGKLGTFVTAEFERQGTLADGRRIPYARGLRVENRHGIKEVSHAGATAAYRAWLARFPAQSLSIAVLCNASDVGPSAANLGYLVADRLLPPDQNRAPKPRPLANIAQRAGQFVSERTGMPLTLKPANGRLLTGDGTSLDPVDRDRLKLGGEMITFRGSDRFEIARNDGNIETYARAPTGAESPPDTYIGRYTSDELEALYFIERGDKGLVLRLDRRPELAFPLHFIYRDAFLYESRAGQTGGIIRFVRNAQGEVTGFTIGVNERARAVRFNRSAQKP